MNGRIFLTNDDGQTFVVEAGRQFKLLKTNELGEQTLASPALVDGTLANREFPSSDSLAIGA